MKIDSLLNPNKYQVFLFLSPASLPFSFARHSWFVVNKKGVITRWEVKWRPQDYDAEKSWGHLCLNSLPPTYGLRIFHFWGKFYWKATLIKMIEGGEKSLVEEMCLFIENSPTAYPYKENYSFFGPNSNTYVEWVINKFRDAEMSLPWNAFGKGKVNS